MHQLDYMKQYATSLSKLAVAVTPQTHEYVPEISPPPPPPLSGTYGLYTKICHDKLRNSVLKNNVCFLYILSTYVVIA